jgi:hypothetical protein
MRNSMMVRESYDASTEAVHSVRVIVSGYEVAAVKASAVEGWADLDMMDRGDVVRVKGTVEFLMGSPLTSIENALAAMNFLAARGPQPDPRKVRRWASFSGQ